MEQTLFTTALIPKTIADSLPSGYTLRPLQSGDYDRGVLDVLSVLTTVGDISKQKYLGTPPSRNPSNSFLVDRFEWLRKRNDSYFTIVIVNGQDKVVGVGSLLIEAKFIHSCALAGHIEDIAVAKSEQGKKLGIKIIHALMDISEKVGCYKTTLVCADHNVKFYERCGFVKGQNEMVRSSLPQVKGVGG
jgi:glucosamine-phosphate N-acetyltransferase